MVGMWRLIQANGEEDPAGLCEFPQFTVQGPYPVSPSAGDPAALPWSTPSTPPPEQAVVSGGVMVLVSVAGTENHGLQLDTEPVGNLLSQRDNDSCVLTLLLQEMSRGFFSKEYKESFFFFF